MPARKACARLPSMSISPLKYASRKPTWPNSSTRHAARPLRMRMVTSGVRWWFCQEEPSAKTTRKQTSVFAPISSIVFLSCLFMISLESRCARRDLDSFLLQIEVAGGRAGEDVTRGDGGSASLLRPSGPPRPISSEKYYAHFRRRALAGRMLRLCADPGGGAVPLDRERGSRGVLPPGRCRDRPLHEEQVGRNPPLRGRREGPARDGEAAHRQGRRREGADPQRRERAARGRHDREHGADDGADRGGRPQQIT